MEDKSVLNSVNPFNMGSKYVIRKTQKEVEVVAFNLVESGNRNDDDWVTYIDSKGKEHIKEKLNIQLDLKVIPTIPEMFKNLLDAPKLPSTDNNRIYEIAKGFILNKGYPVDRAIAMAKDFVTKVKDLEVE